MTHARVVVVATLAATLGAWWLQPGDPPGYFVTSVFDGDTIEVRDPNGDVQVVRMLGVDTPETHHPTKPVGCFGPEASNATTEKLLGRTVHLRVGVESHDKYGRLLAIVMLEDENMSEWLLRAGYARVLVISPNDAQARSFVAIEQAAREQGRGLWGVRLGES